MLDDAVLEIRHAIDLPAGSTPTGVIVSRDGARCEIMTSNKTFDTSLPIVLVLVGLMVLGALVAGVRMAGRIRRARGMPRRARALYCDVCNHEFIEKRGKDAYFCPECGTTRSVAALARGQSWVRRSWGSMVALGVLPVALPAVVLGVVGALITFVPPPWHAPRWMANLIVGSVFESTIAPRHWSSTTGLAVVDLERGVLIAQRAVDPARVGTKWIARLSDDTHIFAGVGTTIVVRSLGDDEPIATLDPSAILGDVEMSGVLLAREEQDGPTLWVMVTRAANPGATPPQPPRASILRWRLAQGDTTIAWTMPAFVDARGAGDHGSWTGCWDADTRPVFLWLAGDREHAQTGARPLRVLDASGQVLRAIDVGDPEVVSAILQGSSTIEAAVVRETRTAAGQPAGTTSEPSDRKVALGVQPTSTPEPEPEAQPEAQPRKSVSYNLDIRILPPANRWTFEPIRDDTSLLAWSTQHARCFILAPREDPEAGPAAPLPAPPAQAAAGS